MSQMTGLGRACALVALLGGMQGAFAQGLAGTASPAAQPVEPASAPVAAIPALDAQAQTPIQAGDTTGPSTVDELQRQIQAHTLTEMRTNYNGSYGASLLFNVKDGAYFVALFQQKAFWRVIKTYNEVRAEAVYRDFSRQAEHLAVNELRAAKLESQKAQTDRQIEVTQERARRLQADLSIAREQQAAVTDRQKTVRSETAALQAQQAELQAQLRALKQQVRSLQREAYAGLPHVR
ncbi:hypothetical protein WM16_24160 [Burkholderia ubonensis]|uniref:Uncharacterized protein n=1 Tax=Burkholderia ubonensis TaxID=101571 RepID=A0A108C733_9BURK|nr:DUF2968 domain-containing protein [Burkholderia ubonensis]KWK69224.1 hypothetical protein WM16_24160 [Burkholderia ubonensis]